MRAPREVIVPGELHPVLVRLLPALDTGARHWLSLLLAPLAGSAWPGVAWRWSRLTPTWFPVELSLRTGNPAVRYALEITAPETPMWRRLAGAAAFLSELGLLRPPTSAGPEPVEESQGPLDRLLPLLLTWHSTATDLRWAVWLGGRHEAGLDRFKLYVEVPRARRAEAALLARRATGLDSLPGTPVMVGLDLAGERQEWYVEPGPVSRDEVSRLVGAETVAVLDRVAGGTWRPGRPAFSVAVTPGTGLETTVVLDPRELCGPDGTSPDQLAAAVCHAGLAWDDPRGLLDLSPRAAVVSVAGGLVPAVTLGLCVV